MTGYIYHITNKINNKKYIGKTINIANRIKIHFQKLKNNEHHSIKLQNSFNKYGEENFEISFTIYNNIDNERLSELEIEEIEKFDSFNSGFNCTIGGDSPPNLKKYKKEDMLNCLCVLMLYDNMGKVLEELFNYSKGSMSKLKTRQRNLEIWEEYERLSLEERNLKAINFYSTNNLETLFIEKQLKQGGCKKAYLLNYENYNFAFAAQELKKTYSQVAQVLEISPATVKDWFNGRSRKKDKEKYDKLSLLEKEKYKNQVLLILP